VGFAYLGGNVDKITKVFLIIYFFILVQSLLPGMLFAQYYRTDYLEPINSGGWGTSLKTFDNEFCVKPGDVWYVDIWMRNVSSLPDPTAGGCFLDFKGSTAFLKVNSVSRYGKDYELPGPWDTGGLVLIGPVGDLQEGQVMIQVANLSGAQRDSDGDIIITRVEFECVAEGTVNAIVSTIPGFDTWGPTPPWNDGEIAHAFIMMQQDPGCPLDSDLDGVPDDGDKSGMPGDNLCGNGGTENCDDNCLYTPNGPTRGTCTNSITRIISSGQYCTDDSGCERGQFCEMVQSDTYPPGGNGIGDACDCEANFDCDQDVDAQDVTAFLADFGRSIYNRPCTNEDPCKGDFSCDGDVDAVDVTKFIEDFGRSRYNNPCPLCELVSWCVYP